MRTGELAAERPARKGMRVEAGRKPSVTGAGYAPQGKYLTSACAKAREKEWYRETCFRLFGEEDRAFFIPKPAERRQS